jgi:hypothetical protein
MLCKLPSEHNTHLAIAPTCSLWILVYVRTSNYCSYDRVVGAGWPVWGALPLPALFQKYVKHQADIQARNKQTGKRNLFCSERYKAPVGCTRHVKNFLSWSMNGAKWSLGPLYTSAGFYLLDNLKVIIYWKRVNTRDELWRLFMICIYIYIY